MPAEQIKNKPGRWHIAILILALILMVIIVVVLQKRSLGPNVPVANQTSQQPINIGVHINDSPGFSALHDGQRNGFDIDLANYIAEGLGRHPNFVPITVDSRDQQLKEGYVDMVVSTYSITDERIKGGIIFAGPYLRTDQGILVMQENSTIRSINDLAGQTVCVSKGSTSAKKLDELKKSVALVSTERDTLTQCIDDMKNPTTGVAAITSDTAVLQGYARADKSLKFLPGLTVPGTYEKYGIGLSKNNMELCHKTATLLKHFVNTQWNAAFNANLQAADGSNATELKPDPSTIDIESCRTN